MIYLILRNRPTGFQTRVAQQLSCFSDFIRNLFEQVIYWTYILKLYEISFIEGYVSSLITSDSYCLIVPESSKKFLTNTT